MKRIFAATFLVLFGVLVIYLVFTVELVGWDFRNNLWAPAYLTTHHQSAYNIQVLFKDSNAIWFPQVIGVFFFLGFFPQYPASNLWAVFNIALLLALVWYSVRQSGKKVKPLKLGFLTACIFLFPPTIRHFALGQVDILIMMAFIAAVYAVERQHLTLAAFLFALALAKPQHSIVVLPLVFVYLFFIQKSPRDSVKLFLAICFFALLQTAPLWFGDPLWPRDFLSNLHRNPAWAQPGIFTLLQNRFGASGLALWFLLYAIILAANLRIWSKNKPEKALLWSLASTAIISPYLWSWDFVLFLPLFTDTAFRLSSLPSKLTLFLFYTVCFYGAILALQGGTASDEVLWWLPFVLTIGIVGSIIADLPSPRLNNWLHK